MTAMSNSDFKKRMMLLARPAKQFEPTATYDPDGDCIEFLAKPNPFYAERVDDLVTVYYSQETIEVIGSLINGVAGFTTTLRQECPGRTSAPSRWLGSACSRARPQRPGAAHREA